MVGEFEPRFYRVLYASLLAPEFRRSSKNNLYLNLLYRVLKTCKNRRIVMALLKRVLQCAMMMPANMACGLLYMVSTVLSERKELKVNAELKKLMEEERFDLVHCHTPMGGALARLAARKTKTGPVIYTAHGFHFFKGAPLINWLVYYPVERWLSRFTDVQVTINHEDYMRAKNQFKARRTVRIHGVGIDLAPSGKSREEKRWELGIQPDEILLLTAGELNRNKNQRMVLEAMGKLKGVTEAKLVYAACGKGDCLESLEKRARELGIEASVRFLGYREDFREILKAADIFLMPSYREGLPTVVMEAMSAGLPVIGTDIRGNRDLIQPGTTGYLVGVDDAGQMAQAS